MSMESYTEALAALPQSTRDPVTWDELVGRIQRLFEVTNEHDDRLHALEKAANPAPSVKEATERAQWLAQHLGVNDPSPAKVDAGEVMRNILDDWTERLRDTFDSALTEPANTRQEPANAPTSPEDTEGLEVVGVVNGGGHTLSARGLAWQRAAERGDPSDPVTWDSTCPENAPHTPLVRLSDAVEKIRGVREVACSNEAFERTAKESMRRGDEIEHLTARLESVERERDEARKEAEKQRRFVAYEVREGTAHCREIDALKEENRTLRQRLEGMVVTEEMLIKAAYYARYDYQKEANYLNRALHGEGGTDDGD